jgi:hypothetical protein
MKARTTGRFLGMLIGTAVSPTFLLLQHVLNGYMDIAYAMTGPDAMTAEMDRLSMWAAAFPDIALYELLPRMMLVCLLGSLVVGMSTILGGHVAVHLVSRRLLPSFRVR